MKALAPSQNFHPSLGEFTLGLRTRIARRIEEIPPEDWIRVFPPVLENYHFFKSLDESNFEQFRFYYLLIYDHEDLVGATSCFLMNYPLETTIQGAPRYFLNAFKKIFPNLFNLRALICGLPMGPGRIGVRGENRGGVLRAILEGMEQIAREEKIPIVALKDFDPKDDVLLDPLQKEGFYKFRSLPNTELDVSFTSFDQYLKTLSPASRYDLKRKFKKVDGHVKIELEVSNHPDHALEEIHGLYLQTSTRSEMQFEKVPKDFFEKVSKNMLGETKYFFWRIDKKLVAFTFCLVSGDRLIDYYLGLDYSIAYQYHLYFVRFRDLLNWCLAHKIKTYEMGNTSYEPKRRLGFNFLPLYVYAKHRNPRVNPFFKMLCRALKPDNFDPIFKGIEKKKSR